METGKSAPKRDKGNKGEYGDLGLTQNLRVHTRIKKLEKNF
jgi:hypothetical protein